jgi:hypothetical protein
MLASGEKLLLPGFQKVVFSASAINGHGQRKSE